MLNRWSAAALAQSLDDALGQAVEEVTSAPWDDENDQWIVTVWMDGEAVVDIFEREADAYSVQGSGGTGHLGGAVVTHDALPQAMNTSDHVRRHEVGCSTARFSQTSTLSPCSQRRTSSTSSMDSMMPSL